jgi:hypothetical protein
MHAPQVDWAALLARARATLAGPAAPEVARFLGEWPEPGAPRAVAPSGLAVLRWLDVAVEQAPPGPLAALAQASRAAAAALAWRQSYRPGEVAADFLDRYGWCELFGRTGPIPSDALAGGLLLLGPATHYPAHSHAAEELYVPLSGVAEWQRGTAPFARRRPGEFIRHASGEMHAMRTAAAPLLALYLWRGAGLDETARLGAAALV